jgi:antitoxin (DNA-binding transcriptional repressor) of toxin-antitoxin stability system
MMTKHRICVSEAQAVRDFGSVLARIREGAEVIIRNEGQAIAIVSPAEQPVGRLVSESIVLAEAHAPTAVMDADFAKDVQEAVDSHREPFDPPEWD